MLHFACAVLVASLSWRGGAAPARRASAVGMSAPVSASGVMRYYFEQLTVRTGAGEGELVPRQEISLHDITPAVQALVERLGITHGTVSLISQHTTTALTINEFETRLMDDVREFICKLAPPAHPYKHNDLHLRPASDADYSRIDRNWMSQGKGTLEDFMAQEPVNAHAHLGAMVLGASETVPVSNGRLCIGQWQSIILVDLDGPRERKVGVQVQGI
jgi:thiamine phosphate synthase YjbQ (UPF0047 family)